MDKLNKDGLTEAQFLANYNADKYKKPAVTVDMLVFTIGNRSSRSIRKLPDKKLKILMVKRRNHPYIDQWALPGGFVDLDEGLKDAAKRELAEETGIDVDREEIYMEQLYTWGDVERDPRMRVISVSYISLVDSERIELCPGDDAGEACWFELQNRTVSEEKKIIDGGYILKRTIELKLENEDQMLSSLMMITRTVRGSSKKVEKKILNSDGIAFDHSFIIEYGLERLKNKIEYTDIAFNLMPEYFTLTELQKVYEIILGKKLLKANFRRKIEEMVIDTGRVRKYAAHRPAKLYMFNPEWDKSILE